MPIDGDDEVVGTHLIGNPRNPNLCRSERRPATHQQEDEQPARDPTSHRALDSPVVLIGNGCQLLTAY
jgi:hypothetical protein